jgi:hypothetical protein
MQHGSEACPAVVIRLSDPPDSIRNEVERNAGREATTICASIGRWWVVDGCHRAVHPFRHSREEALSPD